MKCIYEPLRCQLGSPNSSNMNIELWDDEIRHYIVFQDDCNLESFPTTISILASV